jgi:hypothetical protein
MQCLGITRRGTRCTAHALRRGQYCILHSGQAPELGRLGGQRRSLRVRLQYVEQRLERLEREQAAAEHSHRSSDSSVAGA